jgi:hypothetical protein
VRLLFGDFIIDEDTRQLLRGDHDVHVSPKAFDLLAALLAARPRALSKTELHARLWPDTFVSEANLAMLVAEVRNATQLAGPQAFEPASGFKYWIVAPLRQIPLTAGENVVGRDPSVQVWLDSPSVSRRHARITIDGDRVTLEDLTSKNGTRVRDSRVTAPLPLVDGDEVRFGSISVTFRIWTAGEATMTEPD